jgi:hypothetical protein
LVVTPVCDCVRSVVDKVALGQVFLHIPRVSPVTVIPSSLPTHISGMNSTSLVAAVQRRSLTPSKSISQSMLTLWPTKLLIRTEVRNIDVVLASILKGSWRVVFTVIHVLLYKLRTICVTFTT